MDFSIASFVALPALCPIAACAHDAAHQGTMCAVSGRGMVEWKPIGKG